MKIGLVAENYYPTVGGIQEHVYHLARWLRSNGADVRILTGDTGLPTAACPPGAMDDVIHVGRALRYPVMGTYSYMTVGPDAVGSLWNVLRREQFDLLHLHGPLDVGVPLLAHALYHGPMVFTLHSCFPDAPWRRVVAPLYRAALRRAAAIIAVSEATRASVARYADFDSEIIPNGVDIAYWQKGQALDRFRDGWRNLLFVGRLEPRNGIDALFRAFTRIADKAPRVRLIVAGDGPMRKACEDAVPARLRDRVVFLGAVNGDRADLFASADLLLLPAQIVGFSILVLEALAAGLPVVASPGQGVRTAGAHWATAIVSADGSPESFADTVLAGLESDNSARIRRGFQVVKEYDWSNVAPRVFDVYQRALERVATRASLLDVA